MTTQKEYMKQIQTLLKSAGHYSDIVDGLVGKNTLLAVQALIAKAQPVKNDDPVIIITDKDVIVKPTPVVSKGYKLSSTSLSKLSGINPNLAKVVRRAIEITDMDFAVNEGLRTVERQRQLYNSGASQTMKSNHLTGHAVDLVPTPNGKMNWNDWDNYYPVVLAMQKAAEELNVIVKWGGCWEIINNKSGNPKDWVNAYGDRQRAKGKKPFTDGPHFELLI